jgi:hypothetical protein
MRPYKVCASFVFCKARHVDGFGEVDILVDNIVRLKQGDLREIAADIGERRYGERGCSPGTTG